MKKTLIELGIVLTGAGILAGLVYYNNKKEVALIPVCPTDVMMCPDGTSVGRSGSSCEFGVCKQELPSYLIEASSTIESKAATPKETVSLSPRVSLNETPVQKPSITTNLFKKITTQASSLFSSASKSAGTSISSGIEKTSSAIQTNEQEVTKPIAQQITQATSPAVSQALNETRFKVENGKIVTADQTVIYVIPKATTTSSGSSGSWTTTIVDVVPVNAVTPIIGAVPVDGLPGKYYLSENSFGSLENCEFSNKIYILDTVTGSRTLMFEENSSTLARDDERSCNSEIYLLATEAEKLIMKYHTVGTNSVCDSTWSEPGKTWYLNVTKLDTGTKRYAIPAALYAKAEQEEDACRTQFQQNTGTSTVIGG
jgi:biotin carboxyl carrier protein